MQKITIILKGIVEGDFTLKPQVEYIGVFGQIKESIGNIEEQLSLYITTN